MIVRAKHEDFFVQLAVIMIWYDRVYMLKHFLLGLLLPHRETFIQNIFLVNNCNDETRVTLD